MRDWIDRLFGLMDRLETELQPLRAQLSPVDCAALDAVVRDIRNGLGDSDQERELAIQRFDFISDLPYEIASMRGNLMADPPYVRDAVESLDDLERMVVRVLGPQREEAPTLGYIAAVEPVVSAASAPKLFPWYAPAGVPPFLGPVE